MTMTSGSTVPPLEPVQPRPLRAPAEELSDDIVARPLTLPDFVTDIKSYLVNQNLEPRWIFTDRRRYAQAKAQGWRNASAKDFKPGFASLTPYLEEGGTKIVNGDLILMVIDRKIYLGAKRYKHQVAAALADAAVQRTVSAKKAVGDLGEQVAAVNRQHIARGSQPVMSVFTPGAADLSKTPLGNDSKMAKEVGRLGHEGAPDTGTAADLK